MSRNLDENLWLALAYRGTRQEVKEIITKAKGK